MAPSYRTLWISDVHLGTQASRTSELLEFLAAVKAERIFLVGDIVDLQRMKRRPIFPEQHLRVLTEIVRLASSSSRIVYIPGNHDYELRNFAGKDIFGIQIMLEAIHATACGKRLLVTHGDILDGRIRRGTHLEKFGAAAYFLLMQADVLFNRLSARLGKEHFPISTAVKRRLRSATDYMDRFEVVAAQYALERGFDGIVCGHIHRPAMRQFGASLYLNDGDWVEHRSALAESSDGTLQLLHWQSDTLRVVALPQRPQLAA